MPTPLLSRVVGSLHDLHIVDRGLSASNYHVVAKRHARVVEE